MKTVGCSMWFGEAPPHSVSLDILLRTTDANGVHTHASKHFALVDLQRFRDERSGLSGADIIDALGRMTRALAAPHGG
jgi:hypothetical protein